jgi:hypothetical protein
MPGSPLKLWVDLLGSTVCCPSEDPGIGGKRERNLGHVVHAHPCGNSDRDHLNDHDGALSHELAA